MKAPRTAPVALQSAPPQSQPMLPTLRGADAGALRLQMLLSQLGPASGAVSTAPFTGVRPATVDGVTQSLQQYSFSPEGKGTQAGASIAAMAVTGRPHLGSDGALNCVQGAAYAQELFATARPPVETELVVGTNDHAVLRLPDGGYYDPQAAMEGGDPLVPQSEEHHYDGVDGITLDERRQMEATARSAHADARASGQSEEQALATAEDSVLSLAARGAMDERSARAFANGTDVDVEVSASAQPTIGVRATVTHSKDKSEPYPTADGGEAVTFEVETRITLGIGGGVSAGRLGVDGEVYEGRELSYELEVPSDVAAQVEADMDAGRAPNPVDPRSIPLGGTVLVTDEALRGSSFEVAYAGLGVGGGQERTEGLATGVTRTGEDTVQVVRGPTEAVRQSGSVSYGVGPFSFGFGGGGELRTSELSMVELDISGPEGEAAYQQFLATGELPEPPPTYADGRPVVLSGGDISQTDASSAPQLEADVGGLSFSIEGQTRSMQARRTVLDDGSVTEEAYHQEGDRALHIGATYDSQGKLVEGPTYTVMLDDVDQAYFEMFSQVFPEGAGGGAREVEGDQIVTLTFTEPQLLEMQTQARAQIGQNQDPPMSADEVQVYFSENPDGGQLNLTGPGISDQTVGIAEAQTPRDVALVLTTGQSNPEQVLQDLKDLSVFASPNYNDPSTWRPLPGSLGFREATG